jgi:hypothetical protein
MAPATGTALLILVAFVLPGFITLVARETTYVMRDAATPFERLLLSLSYSAHPTPSSLGVWVPHKHIIYAEMYRPQHFQDQASEEMTGDQS